MLHHEQTPASGPLYECVRVISPEALLQSLRSKITITLVDVRSTTEACASGTLPHAWLIPLPQLTGRIEELAHLRACPIVVISQREMRSKTAALQLQRAGFGEVFVLEGGAHRWQTLGYPLEERGAHARRCGPATTQS